MRICLRQFKTDTATRKVFVWVWAVMAFHVEHRYGCGEFIARGVVVTNDDINAFAVGVCDFLNGFDATV